MCHQGGEQARRFDGALGRDVVPFTRNVRKVVEIAPLRAVKQSNFGMRNSGVRVGALPNSQVHCNVEGCP